MLRRYTATALFALTISMAASATGASQPAIIPASGPNAGMDQAIREKVGLNAYTLQALALPEVAPEFVRFDVGLGAMAARLEVTLDPVDSPDCTMILDDGSGTPRVLPAPPPCTYRGTVVGQPGSVVSGSILNGQFTGIVILAGGAWNILPLNQAWPGSPRGTHIVARFEDSVAGNWQCGVTDNRPPALPGLSGVTPANLGHPDAPYVCEIAIDADYPYYQLLGSNASAVAQDIATVMANASSYSMLSGCNLKLRIVRYVIRTSSAGNPGLYNTNDPNMLLQGMRQVWANLGNAIPRDVAHLFTGRDLGGVTIGIAYLSTVCSPSYGYGLNQSRFSLQPGRRAAVAAHELGHNFSARHCDDPSYLCSPCWLMTSSQGSTTNQLTRFGCSTGVIAAFIPGRSCLGPGDGGILGAPSCPADIDRDGTLDARDFSAFAGAFVAGDHRSDLDRSGTLDINDYVAFLTAYSRGCR